MDKVDRIRDFSLGWVFYNNFSKTLWALIVLFDWVGFNTMGAKVDKRRLSDISDSKQIPDFNSRKL